MDARLSSEPIEYGLDVEDGGSVQDLEVADPDPQPLNGEDPHTMQPDGVRAVWRSRAEQPRSGAPGSSPGTVLKTSRCARSSGLQPQLSIQAVAGRGGGRRWRRAAGPRWLRFHSTAPARLAGWHGTHICVLTGTSPATARTGGPVSSPVVPDPSCRRPLPVVAGEPTSSHASPREHQHAGHPRRVRSAPRASASSGCGRPPSTRVSSARTKPRCSN
jgi:hypothetical protein